MKKRRDKDPYTYKIELLEGKEMFTVSFVDGQGSTHEVCVNRTVFTSLRQLQLAENRRAYKEELYISHYIEEADDEGLCSIAFAPLPTVEDTVLNIELADIIAGLIVSLTDAQRRRFLMYRVDGLTYKEIAELEECSLRSIYKSVQSVTKKIEKTLKNFSREG